MKKALLPLLSILLVTLSLAQAPPKKQPKFYPDDPLLVDDDRVATPEPAEIAIPELFDRFSHIVKDPGSAVWGEAENMNTLDEVPDNSWFTNRHALRRMSISELERGPDTLSAPDPNTQWTVIRGKNEGITPGFSITDDRGVTYVIKFGAPEFPTLNSASEVVATKIFYAAGYHTPENHIVYLKAENLRIEPGTRITDRFGEDLELTQRTLDDGLKDQPRQSDGTYRVIASRFVAGKPLGPFRYWGRRTDDPNDIYDHEQRRELRGLRLIAAWLNHDDTRAHNTLDTWVEENGKSFLRHYLIDFGSCFGSGTSERQLANLSYQYWLDPGLIKQNAAGFGFHVPTYRRIKWPDRRQYPGIGRFEADFFDPKEWKNDYPNPAFLRMTERDAFWAARIVMSFSEKELRALTKLAEFGSTAEEDLFLKILVERQRKVGVFGINAINPLDEFTIDGDTLSFSNLSEKYGLSSPGSQYEIQLGVYDNSSGAHRDHGDSTTQATTSFTLPAVDFGPAGEPFLTISIRTHHPDHEVWKKEVKLYLRPDSGSFKLVGIDRESTPSVAPVKK